MVLNEKGTAITRMPGISFSVGAIMKVELPVTNSTGARRIGGMFTVIIAMIFGWKSACGASVMNYDEDGNDYFQFTTPSTASSPHTFVPLGAVNFNPSNPSGVQSATWATLTPANGYLATNVAAVKFDFTAPAPENGYCGYSEIQVFGVPNLPPAVPKMMGRRFRRRTRLS